MKIPCNKWLVGVTAAVLLCQAAPALAHNTDWYTQRGQIPPGQVRDENPDFYYSHSGPFYASDLKNNSGLYVREYKPRHWWNMRNWRNKNKYNN